MTVAAKTVCVTKITGGAACEGFNAVTVCKKDIMVEFGVGKRGIGFVMTVNALRAFHPNRRVLRQR